MSLELKEGRSDTSFLQSLTNGIKAFFAKQVGDTSPQEKNSIVVLDGVRAIAILLVISYHINLITHNGLWAMMKYPIASSVAMGGGTGVSLFFILSGFLLFMPYAKAFLFESQWPSAKVFYMRRALRILPGYFLSLFVLVILLAPEYLRPDHWKDLFLFITLFMDSTAGTFRKINGPYWTLAIEWQFYMIMPLLMIGIALVVRFTRNISKNRYISAIRRLQVVVFCLLGIIAYGVASRYWGNYYLTHMNESFLVPRKVTDFFLFFLYGRIGKYLEDFGVGMLISLIYIYTQRKSEGSASVRTLRRLSPSLWGVGIFVLFMYAIWHFNIDQHGWPALDSLKSYYSWLDEIMISIGFGACVVAILFGNLPIRRVFEWSVLRWIGLISYSLYIWHLQILLLLTSKILPQWPHIAALPMSYGLYYVWVLVAVFPFCFGVYIWIEKPWMNLSDRFKKRMTPRSARVTAPVVETPAEVADERMMEKEQEEVAI